MESLKRLLQDQYQIQFKNERLLKEAFTHSSYANEHREEQLPCNERLEYLGDAVLELLVSTYLFKEYPELPEGKLTRFRAAIVKEDSLAYFAKEVHFDEHIFLGKGEEKANGRQRPALLCDLFEAFLGALYLDQGLEKVQAFLNQVMFPKVKSGTFTSAVDYKTKLQELLQKQGEVKIQYQLVAEEGPAHNRSFKMAVYCDGNLLSVGTGRSKKQAEQIAAQKAIQEWQERG